MGGSDPATYELLQKVKTLQSRLIHKSEEVLEKDQLMMEKEKAYTALKTVLARQPGPEIAEQVVLYKDNLSQKSRQMRAMVTEVKTYQAQVNEYKDEVSREQGATASEAEVLRAEEARAASPRPRAPRGEDQDPAESAAPPLRRRRFLLVEPRAPLNRV